MLKQYSHIFRRFLILFDCLVLSAAFFTAYAIRKHFDGFFPYQIYFIKYYIWILPVAMVLWVGAFYVLRMYESFRLKKIREILWIILQASFISFMVFSSVSYVFKIEHISRSFVGIFFFSGTVFFIIQKFLMVLAFRQLRRSGLNFRNILVVGTGARARKFIRHLNQHRELGLKVIGLVDEDVSSVGKVVEDHTVLGTLEKIPDILRTNVVDYAVFIMPSTSLHKIEQALAHCELVGVTASVAMDLFNMHFTVGKESSLMGIPMITFETTPHSMMALVFKRMADVFISLMALILISPLYLMIAILIKLTSRGPVYFKQERCGLSGRRFKLYKFRTMVVDAEAKLQDLLAHNEMQGPAFKMTNDPRITPMGRFLRKFSLDELPQLWNVLVGDMSLVGPRPPLPREVKQYDPWHQRRLSMRPGITCLWQAGGRSRVTNFDEWVRMDLEYIDNWSPMLDIKILIRTVPAVLLGHGAK